MDILEHVDLKNYSRIMNKLLLLLLLSFGFMGLANAEYNYTCENSEASFFYNQSKQEITALKPLPDFDIIYSDYQNWDSNYLVLNFFNSPFINHNYTKFKINDYEDYQNFNATLTDETDIFSNLTYDNGSLALTWMDKDSSSIGAYFANCTESYLIIDYDPEPYILIVIPIYMCGDLVVDFDKPDEIGLIEVKDGGAWYVEKPVLIDLAPDDPICIKAKNHVFEAKGGWRHNDRILPYESFVTEWFSGDNFDEFYKYDVGDDFRESPGKYFGKEIPTLEGIVPSWDSNDMVYISVPLDTLDYDKKNESNDQDYLRNLYTEKIRLKNHGVHFKTTEPHFLETYYATIGMIDEDTCHELAPNIKGKCIDSRIIYLQDYGGGSIGATSSIGIFGLFQLDNGKEYMVPLKYLTEKEALNYINK